MNQKLYLDITEDIWHSDPEPLPEYVVAALDVRTFCKQDKLSKVMGIDIDRVLYIDENNGLGVPEENWNPESAIQFINFHRQRKTEYEQYCIREANRLAAVSHTAAKRLFWVGDPNWTFSTPIYRVPGFQRTHCLIRWWPALTKTQVFCIIFN